MLWIYRFICGWLSVSFSGDVAEIILNICAKNRISLWDSKRVKGKIVCSITAGDFKRLRTVTRGSGIRAHILKKHGLPFIIKRYNKRFGILAGVCFFAAFLKIMSCFIWIVDVNGNSYVKTSEILNACREIGIYEGVAAKKINPQIQKQQLLLKLDTLAWASLNIEGSRLTVSVTEVRKMAEDGNAPTNLKAAADGIIKKIDVTSGNCVVKVGDIVKKGDLLVSGVIERADSTRFVHSSGSVTALTEREISVSGKYERTEPEKTGEIRKRRVIEFFGLKFPLYLGKISGSCQSSLKTEELELLGQTLPVRLYTKRCEMTAEKKVSLSREQLEAELEKTLSEQIKKEKIGKYELKSADFSESDGELTLKALISAEEDIVFQDILLIYSGN